MIFSDLIVVELASVLAGPSVGMFWAELGARVIKIENARTGGDVTRTWKLPAEPRDTDRPAYFCAVNWGKESITLDLTQPADQEIAWALIRKADIVITSYIPGAARRIGMDADTLMALNPRLIIGEVSGYGPDVSRAAFDAIIQAEAGFTALNGMPGHISKMPVALMDVLAAHQLKEALLIALIHRMQTGQGSRVHASLLAAGVSALVNQAGNWLMAGHIPQPQGSDHPNIVPYGTLFQTRDAAQIVLAIGNDAQFAALCEVLGLVVPDTYRTNPARVQHREAVKAYLARAIATRDRDSLLAALLARQVPAGAVYEMPAVFEQSLAKSLIMQAPGVAGVRTLAATGTCLTPVALTPPPALDAHGEALRAEARQLNTFLPPS
ncbi:MAG: CoA transferase [Bacteroidia bacterium]|nr:CoA transferase [Bacteroidia bacterium]